MEENRYSYIDENLARIKERMRACAADSAKATPCVLLAAVKSAGIDEINYLHRVHGVCDIGENRVQQLLGRYDSIEDRENIRLHFIGSLQRNKVKYIIDKVDMIHSVDSVELAREIAKRCASISKTMDILLEVNIGREESKSGLLPESLAETARLVDSLDGVCIRGFMTMAPICENDSEYRRYFRQMRELAYEVWTSTLNREGAPLLSMGMSQSFEPAIIEGADIVRIGRQLFATPQ